MKLRIHHVALQAAQFDQSIKFYTEILGAERLERPPFKRREMAWRRIGTPRLELFSARHEKALSLWSDFQPGPVHLAFEVPNLNAFLTRALEREATFHPSQPEPFTPPVPGAGRMAYLLGPDGEEVEIREPD
jgi:catechol 2,3-dioxygenase-like lactoylglutathione lyase family enzyme